MPGQALSSNDDSVNCSSPIAGMPKPGSPKREDVAKPLYIAKTAVPGQALLSKKNNAECLSVNEMSAPKLSKKNGLKISCPVAEMLVPGQTLLSKYNNDGWPPKAEKPAPGSPSKKNGNKAAYSAADVPVFSQPFLSKYANVECSSPIAADRSK